MSNLTEQQEKEQDSAQAIVKDLAEWSRKYPRGRIYHPNSQEEMDGELIAIEERAKALAALQQGEEGKQGDWQKEAEELWDNNSRRVPEDGYDISELNWFLGEDIMLKKDFLAAYASRTAPAQPQGEGEKEIVPRTYPPFVKFNNSNYLPLKEVWKLESTITSLQSELNALREKQGWVAVSERLPENPGKYFVWGKVRKSYMRWIGTFHGHKFGCSQHRRITHWQPLPEPPFNNDKKGNI